MDMREILARCDHTLLKVDATWADVRALCDDGMEWGTASVCVPPMYVSRAKAYVGDRLAVCTVIGFPNGYMTTAAKRFEASDAVRSGADEVDMVIAVGALKAGEDDYVRGEIRAVREACAGRTLKVIIETCLLTEEEKIRACRLVTEGGADYVKTSTGFSAGGATPEDVALLRAHVGAGVKVKASGGISGFKDAMALIEAGADRLGTSRLVRTAKAARGAKGEGER